MGGAPDGVVGLAEGGGWEEGMDGGGFVRKGTVSATSLLEDAAVVAVPVAWTVLGAAV